MGLFKTLCATALFATLPFTFAHAKKGEKAPAAEKLYLLGSSSINGAFGRQLETALEEGGYDVERYGKSSSGFSRPDFLDWQKELKKIKGLKKAKGALVYMGGNDGQGIWLRPDEREGGKKGEKWIKFGQASQWSKVYKARVQTFVQALCDAGLEKVIVLPPMDAVPKKSELRFTRIRALQVAGATAASCGAVVSTSGDAAQLKNKKKAKELRQKDGIHASISGARRVIKRITPKVAEIFPPLKQPEPPAEDAPAPKNK
ncbi:MAG: hypothetical protein ACE366_30395 [Bradymonadia bacterium]